MWSEAIGRGLIGFLGLVFLAGMVAGVALCKVIPWITTHLRIEWIG